MFLFAEGMNKNLSLQLVKNWAVPIMMNCHSPVFQYQSRSPNMKRGSLVASPAWRE